MPLRAHRGVLTRGACALKNTLKAPCSRARHPQLHSAVVPSTRLCALNCGRRCPHSGAPCPQAQRKYPHSRAVGLYWAWRDPDTTNCALENEQAPTRGRTSSPAQGRLPTHGPYAFNHACSGPHHKAVCPQLLTHWFPLIDSVPSCPQRGIPIHGARTINCTQMGPQGCMLPSTAHQGFPTCGLCALNHAWSGPHHKAVHPQLS